MSDNVIRPSITMPDAPRRLTPRVWAERPGTSFEAVSYRIRKALMAGDQATAAEAYRTLDPDQRDAFQKSLDDPDTVTKGAWNRATRRYDLPDGQWSAAHPRPEQKPEQAPPKPRITLAPQETTGMRHAVSRGQIVNFVIDGVRHHGKIVKWGSRGITAVTRDGDVAAVNWSDVAWGVAPESESEHVAKSLSGAMPLWMMSPEQRAQFFALRDPDFEKSAPADEPPAPVQSRWRKLWERIA